mmetsp:Transcript_13468/g.31806  ORF Transcript_13468/g.31806 Transcript_13468/m.31806 type:complete len:300 (-) Transcript_13468:333-1232(-)
MCMCMCMCMQMSARPASSTLPLLGCAGGRQTRQGVGHEPREDLVRSEDDPLPRHRSPQPRAQPTIQDQDALLPDYGPQAMKRARVSVRPHPLHLRLEDIEGHGDHRAHRAGDHAAAQRDVRWHLVRGSAAPHQPLVLSEDDEAQRLVGGRLAHGGEEAAVDARDALRLDEAVDAAQQALVGVDQPSLNSLDRRHHEDGLQRARQDARHQVGHRPRLRARLGDQGSDGVQGAEAHGALQRHPHEHRGQPLVQPRAHASHISHERPSRYTLVELDLHLGPLHRPERRDLERAGEHPCDRRD